jgi:hypothetical protein
VLLLEKAQGNVQIGGRQLGRITRREQRHLQQFGPRFGQIALRHQTQACHQRGQRAFGRLFVQTTRAAQVAVLQATARHQPGADFRFAIAHRRASPACRRLDDCRHDSTPLNACVSRQRWFSQTTSSGEMTAITSTTWLSRCGHR